MPKFTSVARQSHLPLNEVYAMKIVIYFLMIGIGIWGVTAFKEWYIILFAQLLIGAAYAHGIELVHQALHFTGFSNRSLNRIFGVIMGIPMLISFSDYQDSHLYHHQKVGTSLDSEFFNYGNRTSLQFWHLIKHFFMIDHFVKFLKFSFMSLTNREFNYKLFKENAVKIKYEYCLISILVFGVILYTLFTKDLLFVYIWFIPLFAFSSPIHALIELPEHYGCNNQSKDYFENTRTIHSNVFMTWFTNGNNFHVEHHMQAAVPVERLKYIHNEISENIIYYNKTYREFYINFIRDLFTNA